MPRTKKSDRRKAKLEKEYRVIWEERDILEESASDILAKKIFEIFSHHPGANEIEELGILLKKANWEVRVTALQKAAARTVPTSLSCSFCGKSQNEVNKLIAGPRAYVCNECIDICNEIIADDQRYLSSSST